MSTTNRRLAVSAKVLRAHLILDHVRAAGHRGVVAFSCGGATAALRLVGFGEPGGPDLVDVSPAGDLAPTDTWWTPARIHATWPAHFDATSGHLPLPLFLALVDALRDHAGDLPPGVYDVPTGSGETVCALRLAYPTARHVFRAVWDDATPATRYDARGPMVQWASTGGPWQRLPARGPLTG